ncbi:MAG TPA: hypothetical protein VK902_10245 [Rubrobacter sp.]|nr:hypothetical protein [Rubrobacter sp.]
MRTITKSLFGFPGRSGLSAQALVTFAGAIAALALAVVALSPTAAQSAERHNGNNIALSGKTWLKIDKDTASALSDAGVKVEATGAAVGPTAKRPHTFAFPIVGGKVDKDPLGGRIVHSGGLSFSADSESVIVKRFVIDLDRGVLTAKVAGTGQRIALLKLGAPEGAKVGPERIVLRGVDAKLTAQAAKALNEALDTDLFAGGLLIGEATVNAKIGDDQDDGSEDRNDDDSEDRNDDD